ncbi:DNA polymerase III subunit delta [Saxibacter everestensis]|uniref:DNA-directed DNA polymerase n=1 Tax=Saxibacter everestensis TaxID=2909229 RepID=A0ABY8R0C1_9MICO|nr:DNA polymerase III subunit delta [Brevibacteriaceae bacterium ZFBP1038]
MATRERPTAKNKTNLVSWHEAEPAPVVLITGAEEVIVDRAAGLLVQKAHEADPALEVTEIDAASYDAGQLATLTSPSLFGERKLLIASGVEATNDAFLKDAIDYLGDIQSDVIFLFRHSGGVRGKRLLDAIKASGAPVIEATPIKKDSERNDFATGEFRRAKRRITPAALRALIDAVGADLRELASGCQQLISDTEGTIDLEHVELYYGGRVEVTGFKVADAAAAGQTGQALNLLRHAIATGSDPVPLVAAVAMKLRGMAKVSAVGRGNPATVAKEVGMAPWQVDRARRDLSRWSPDALAEAIMAVADADEAVKGGGRDPIYAVEKMIGVVASAAKRRN